MPARPRRPALAALVVAALVVVLSGCAEAVDNQEHPNPPPTTPGNFDAPGTPPAAPGFEVGELPGQVTALGTGAEAAPVQLVIPAIGVETRLVRLGLEPDGGMAVPEDFGRARR